MEGSPSCGRCRGRRQQWSANDGAGDAGTQARHAVRVVARQRQAHHGTTSAGACEGYLLAADAGNGGIDRKRSTRLLALLSTSIFHMPELS